MIPSSYFLIITPSIVNSITPLEKKKEKRASIHPLSNITCPLKGCWWLEFILVSLGEGGAPRTGPEKITVLTLNAQFLQFSVRPANYSGIQSM